MKACILPSRVEFDLINQKANELDPLHTEVYNKVITHSNNTLFAMCFDYTITAYSQYFSWLNNNWLNTNTAENLTSDWLWHHTAAKRIIIPNELYIKENNLSVFIDYIKTNNINRFTDSLDTYIYVDTIAPEHQIELDKYERIKIELFNFTIINLGG